MTPIGEMPEDPGADAAAPGNAGRRWDLKFWLALAVLLMVSLALRTQGLEFGSPAAGCRPDEEIALREALYLLEGNPHVHFFHYPPGLMLLNAYWIKTWQALGWLPEDGLTSFAETPMPFHVAVRRLSAILGAFTCVLVFLIGRALFGFEAGLAGGILMAVLPLHVLHSQMGTVDVPGTFFMAASVAFATLPGRGGVSLTGLWFSALAAGIAAGIKYPFGAVLLYPLALSIGTRHWWRSMLALFAVALGGFLLIAPSFLVQFNSAIHGIGREAGAQSYGRERWAGPHPFIYHLWTSLAQGSGLTPALCALGGIVVAFINQKRALWIALPAVVLVVVHGRYGNVFNRYMIPVVPVVALFAGAFLSRAVRGRGRWVFAGVVALAAALPAMRTADVLAALNGKDTRGELIEAFEDGRLSRDAVVLIPGYPFLVFPFADMSQLMNEDALRAEHDVDPCARYIARAVRRVLDRRRVGDDSLDVRTVGDQTLKHMLNELKGREILFVVPGTFGNWFEWHQKQVRVFTEHAARGDIEFALVASFDPTDGRGFAPRSAYDPHDFWFVPITTPRIARRPGPRIDVYRVLDPER